MRSMTEITVVDTEDSSLISSCRWISYIDVDVSGNRIIAVCCMVWFDSKYIMPGRLFHVSQSTLTASYKRTASYISNLIVFASPTSPFRPILPRKITTTRRFLPPMSPNDKLVRRRMQKMFFTRVVLGPECGEMRCHCGFLSCAGWSGRYNTSIIYLIV